MPDYRYREHQPLHQVVADRYHLVKWLMFAMVEGKHCTAALAWRWISDVGARKIGYGRHGSVDRIQS